MINDTDSILTEIDINEEQVQKLTDTAANQTELALLACPFCGVKAEIVESGPAGKEHATLWQARCTSILRGCIGAEISIWRCTESDATRAWNTRTSTEAEDLIMYADTAAKLLRESGFPGKAKTLESRCMKAASVIGFTG